MEEAVGQEQAGLDPGPSGCPRFHRSMSLSRAICSQRPHGAASGLENKQSAEIQNKQKKNPTRPHGGYTRNRAQLAMSLCRRDCGHGRKTAEKAASKHFVGALPGISAKGTLACHDSFCTFFNSLYVSHIQISATHVSAEIPSC